MLSASDCHANTADADTDVDMTEIKAENERKLAAMTEDEILARQKDLLSALGQSIFIIHSAPTRLATLP